MITYARNTCLGHICRKGRQLSLRAPQPAPSSYCNAPPKNEKTKDKKRRKTRFFHRFLPLEKRVRTTKTDLGWKAMKSSGCKAVQRANCFVAHSAKKKQQLSDAVFSRAPQLSDASCPASSGRQLHPQSSGPSWGAKSVSHSPTKRPHKSSTKQKTKNTGENNKTIYYNETNQQKSQPKLQTRNFIIAIHEIRHT